MSQNTDAIDNILDQIGEISKIAADLGAFIQDSLETEVLKRLAVSGIKGTGALRNSIKVHYLPESSSIQVDMNYYGAFQNWGVIGTKHDPGAKAVDELWVVQPTNGSKYGFKHDVIGPMGSTMPFAVRKHIGQFGIKPKQFIPTKAEVESLIDEFVKQYNVLTIPQKR